MEIRGVHYGLTLLYSYLLPLFRVEEVSGGFVFEKARGTGKGVLCRFREASLTAECTAPPDTDVEVLERVLGLEKRKVFLDFCRRLGIPPGNCCVTLVYEPGDAKHVFYAVYLSRNTDYYVNTVNWAVQAVEMGFVESTSYIPREFNRVKHVVDRVFREEVDPIKTATRLLGIPGAGVKSAVALLLHGYGYTEYAPVDRHYAGYLGVDTVQPYKNYCARMKLNCAACSRMCPYGLATRKYGIFNGVVQSLVYIRARLLARRRSPLETTLVVDPGAWLDRVSRVLELARSFAI